MKFLILGGDGFCGWPTALHLSALGHDIAIVDNLTRRRADTELDVSSLTPIETIQRRIAAWHEISGRRVDYFEFDVALEYERLAKLIVDFKPTAVVHFAEQRAAPYSMKSARNKCYTVNNNVMATHNVLCAIVESRQDIHLVHLGTMGVYGYATDGIIPEGYLLVEMAGRHGRRVEREILYPADPGSIYHMTKTFDQLAFYFYNKNDGLRITDLHQGIVWGTNTRETKLDPRLINRFDYDGDYGTVLNRFLMQAAVGHPLTVYGTGGQTRAFIHIQDTVRCIELALVNPPRHGDRVRIFNQMTEIHRIRALAGIVSQLTGVPIQYLENPRKEPTENELTVQAESLPALGLEPTLLTTGLLEEVINVAKKYSEHCNHNRIICTSRWARENAAPLPKECADASQCNPRG